LNLGYKNRAVRKRRTWSQAQDDSWPGDEFFIGETTEGSMLLKKKDLRAPWRA